VANYSTNEANKAGGTCCLAVYILRCLWLAYYSSPSFTRVKIFKGLSKDIISGEGFKKCNAKLKRFSAKILSKLI